MNDPAMVLAQLHDIHLPSPPSWWPMSWFAIGFLLMSALGFILVLTGLFYHRRRQAAKREALLLLASYLKDYRAGFPASLTSARLVALLKRVALFYYPRREVAGLQGEDWVRFLNASAKGLDFSKVYDELVRLPYQPQANLALDECFRLARLWIKQRRKPCLS